MGPPCLDIALHHPLDIALGLSCSAPLPRGGGVPVHICQMCCWSGSCVLSSFCLELYSPMAPQSEHHPHAKSSFSQLSQLQSLCRFHWHVVGCPIYCFMQEACSGDSVGQFGTCSIGDTLQHFFVVWSGDLINRSHFLPHGA